MSRAKWRLTQRSSALGFEGWVESDESGCSTGTNQIKEKPEIRFLGSG